MPEIVHGLGLTKFQMIGWNLSTRKGVKSTRSDQHMDKVEVKLVTIQEVMLAFNQISIK